jgi:hypothetical protein
MGVMIKNQHLFLKQSAPQDRKKKMRGMVEPRLVSRYAYKIFNLEQKSAVLRKDTYLYVRRHWRCLRGRVRPPGAAKRPH